MLRFHVAISLVGLLTGFVVVYGLLTNQRLNKWTASFLVTTVATSVTGFLLPFPKLLPSHIFGFISLAVLAPAIIARYPKGLAGPWRWIYVVGASIALYLNSFVAIFQSFLKIPGLHSLAPTQSEPPFAIAQGALLVLFVLITIGGLRKFHPEEKLGSRSAAA